MRVLISILGVAASLVLLAVSGAMNYMFLSSLGKTPIEAHALGAASAAADMLKALMPFFIAWGWRSRRYAVALPGLLVWTLFAGFSLLSAIGFAADNRGAFNHTRESLNAAYESALAERKVAEARRATIPKHRPAAVVSEEIERRKQDRRWSSTKSCTDATLPESRIFCDTYFALRAELASGVEAQRINRTIQNLKNETERLRADGAGQAADPQVSLLARLFGHAESRVRLMLIVIVAILVEIGSGLGLFLATSHGAFIMQQGTQHLTVKSKEEDERPAECWRVTAPDGRQVSVGTIEDFCLDCLWPEPSGVLSVAMLYAGYQEWCTTHKCEALEEAAFEAAFLSLAAKIGIDQTDCDFRGIKLKPS